MNRTLALNFRRLADADLATMAGIIVFKMNKSEYFPDTRVMVMTLKEMTDEFWVALSQAGSRDIIKAAAKNKVREQLIEIMRNLGMIVMKEAKGRMTLLLSSGFPLVKKGGITRLAPPTGFKVGAGEKSGEILLQMNRVIGAKSYIYQYTPFPQTPQSVWETVHGTRCKTVLKG